MSLFVFNQCILYKWFKPLESFLIDKNEKEIKYVSKISHQFLSFKKVWADIQSVAIQVKGES